MGGTTSTHGPLLKAEKHLWFRKAPKDAAAAPLPQLGTEGRGEGGVCTHPAPISAEVQAARKEKKRGGNDLCREEKRLKTISEAMRFASEPGIIGQIHPPPSFPPPHHT